VRDLDRAFSLLATGFWPPTARHGLAMAVLGALALAVVARAGVGLGADFEGRRDRRGAGTVRGRVPRAKVGALPEFFARDLGGPGAVSVRGRFGPGGALRLRFAGRLDPARRQRVRNFLIDLLG